MCSLSATACRTTISNRSSPTATAICGRAPTTDSRVWTRVTTTSGAICSPTTCWATLSPKTVRCVCPMAASSSARATVWSPSTRHASNSFAVSLHRMCSSPICSSTASLSTRASTPPCSADRCKTPTSSRSATRKTRSPSTSRPSPTATSRRNYTNIIWRASIISGDR